MSFEDLKKYQPAVVKLLDNSFKKDRLVPVYLFTGPRGTFKKDAARYLASLILCEISGACGQCNQCLKVANGTNPNLTIINPQGEYIKKEQIIDLQNDFGLTSEKKKIFIINEADKMTSSSANSLLKFLEEMSENTYGVLISENANRLLPTIKSRCQTINFAPINRSEILVDLEDRGINKEVAHILASLTYNIEEARKMTNDNTITKMIDLARNIMLSFETGKHNALLIMNTDGRFLIQEQSREYHNMFFDMLTAAQNDKIKILINRDIEMDSLVFCESLVDNAPTLKVDQEIFILEELLKMKERLAFNVNRDLLYAQLFTEIKRC